MRVERLNGRSRSSSELVSFSFGELDEDRDSHHDGSRELEGLFDQSDLREFDVSNSVDGNPKKASRSGREARSTSSRRKETRGKEGKTHPFDLLETLSVTILASLTVPSPNLSSKKAPRSLEVSFPAIWETKTERASESISSRRASAPPPPPEVS